MKNTIQIEEYRSPVWNVLLLISIIVAVIFSACFLLISDVLWTGIFRLLAFAGFAGAVILFLKMRQKPKSIIPAADKENLIIRYYLEGEELKEELFDKPTIKQITQKRIASGWDIFSDSALYEHIISFTDTDKTLNVLVYSGQDIILDQKNSEKFIQFLEEAGIPNSDHAH